MNSLQEMINEISSKLPIIRPIFKLEIEPTNSYSYCRLTPVENTDIISILSQNTGHFEKLVISFFKLEFNVKAKRFLINKANIEQNVKDAIFKQMKDQYIIKHNISSFNRTKFSKQVSSARNNPNFWSDMINAYRFVESFPGIANDILALEFKSLGEKYGRK